MSTTQSQPWPLNAASVLMRHAMPHPPVNCDMWLCRPFVWHCCIKTSAPRESPVSETFFSVPFLLCPLRRRETHVWRKCWRQPPPTTPFSQKKNLVSVKNVARDSGAGNGCADFMGAWTFCRKTPMPITFLVLGGGGIWGLFGGGRSADIIFMDAGIFLIFETSDSSCRLAFCARCGRRHAACCNKTTGTKVGGSSSCLLPLPGVC